METRLFSWKWLGLCIMVSFALFACNQSTVMDYSETVANDNWKTNDALTANFQVTDTSRYHNIKLTARFTQDYPFSNIYVYCVLTDPKGQVLEEVKSFEITSKAGKWLGSGLGDLHAYTFDLLQNYSPKKTGTYSIKVVQHMRQENLPGCRDRGIRVETGEDIF